MSNTAHLIAGRCTTVFEGTREQTQHGDVLVLVKPDQTVLVHDADGYQPVAWLTRPEMTTVTPDRIEARDGSQKLEVVVHETYAHAQYPTSDAGIPVGDCPACGGRLTRSSGAISCPDCESRYRLPTGATVLDETCDCGLPRMRVERGASFIVCLDRECESLDERVKQAFDRKWDCPECGSALRVLRRGGLILGCEAYPDCETGFSFPTGITNDDCDCGLPRFETATGEHCLDRECREHETVSAQ